MRLKATKEGLLWTKWEKTRKRFRGKIVLIDAASGESRTAEALTGAALGFAGRLSAYAAGGRIAFRLPNGAEWLALFLALQRAGLAAVPLDGGLPEEGYWETARQLGASALYLNGNFHALGKARTRSKKICCIKLTSGSGAIPQAVECRAEHLLADGRHIIKTMRIRAGDRNLAAIPFGHSYGLGNLVMPLILQGTSIVCAAEYLPRLLADWIGQHRVTVFPAVPALFRVLAALPPGPELAPLRTVISAGAVLAPAIAQDFFARYGIKIHNFYGSSETGGICYDRTGSASLTGRSVGKPLAGVSVTVKSGRVTVNSPAVAMPGGRWRLGDFGEWNGRNELMLLGRAKPGANIGGKKVHPMEVEKVLRAIPEVTDAIVWLEQNQGRDFLAAGVETILSRPALEKALAARLPAWQLPKSYIVARELPRTSRGKLDLAAIQRG